MLSHLDDNPALVPALWHIEVLNGLLTGHRRGIVSLSEASDFLAKIERLPIRTEPPPVYERRTEIFALAREYGLTAYDATYLDLALRTGSGLVSFDRRLTRAQEVAGIASF